jgi:predicted Zn-dependent protease
MQTHPRRAGLAGIPFALGLAATLGGCALLVSEENQGQRAAAQVEEQIGLAEAPKQLAYVEEIGRRLAAASPRQDVQYRFHILDMPEPNAFALPGGFIYVSRGLLAFLNEEDELAAVIGHEIGHVAARHHVKQTLRDAPLAPVRLATGVGGALASIVSPAIGRGIAATGQITSALVHAPYSREQEREADRIGQDLAASTGWDPKGLSTFMETLGREEALHGGDPNRASFFATHPASAERSRDAARRATQLTRVDRAPVAAGRRAFLERLAGTLVGRHASEGVFDGDDFLHPDLELVWTLPAGWEKVNEDQVVGAVDSEARRGILLQIAAEGSDPMAVAKEAARRVRLDGAPTPLEIHGLPAARAQAREGDVRAELTWAAHRDLVFQLSGFSPSATWSGAASRLRTSADSLRPLRAADRQRIREDRLAVVAARSGETIGALLERSGSRWSAEEAAVANAILTGSRLEGGRWIKITRPTPPQP